MFAILIVAGLVVITGLAFFLNLTILGIILVVVTLSLWAIFSIKIVGPQEMAVKVILGKPRSFSDSGYRFVPLFPGCKIERFPKKMYNLDFPKRKVITKREEGEYGTQVLEVDSVAYLRFPQKQEKKDQKKKDKVHPLIRILQAQIPIKDKELMDWVEEKVVSTIRLVVSGLTWRGAIENLENVEKDVTERLKKHNALLEVGFTKKCIDITIKEIRLASKLEDALPRVDEQRLQAEAAPYEARQRAIETMGSLIQMMAEATGKSKEDVQNEIEGNPELKGKFQEISSDLVQRRMAIDGKSFLDIRVPGAGGLQQILMSLVAALKRMPTGGSSEGEKSGKNKEGSQKKPEDRTYKEDKALIEREAGVTLS